MRWKGSQTSPPDWTGLDVPVWDALGTRAVVDDGSAEHLLAPINKLDTGQAWLPIGEVPTERRGTLYRSRLSRCQVRRSTSDLSSDQLPHRETPMRCNRSPSVLYTAKITCSGCHLAARCSVNDVGTIVDMALRWGVLQASQWPVLGGTVSDERERHNPVQMKRSPLYLNDLVDWSLPQGGVLFTKTDLQ